MPTHSYEKLIRESMIDSMGHVNNATYLEMFEEARWEWCTQNNLGYDFVVKNKIGFAILEAHLRFGQEIHLRQKITVLSEFKSYRKKVGEIHQTITDKSGVIYCKAQFKVGLFDLNERRLIEPDQFWLEAMGMADLYQS